MAVGIWAMGLKFPGVVVSSCAELLPISLTAATFHPDGTSPWDNTELKSSRRAVDREGQRLNTRYGIWLMGEGAEVALDLRTAFTSLSIVIGLTDICSCCRGGVATTMVFQIRGHLICTLPKRRHWQTLTRIGGVVWEARLSSRRSLAYLLTLTLSLSLSQQ